MRSVEYQRERDFRRAESKRGGLTLRNSYDTTMILLPRKVRQLISDLERAGFVNRGGTGGHRNFTHPKGVRITVSGRSGDDAKHYQERDVKRALEAVQE